MDLISLSLAERTIQAITLEQMIAIWLAEKSRYTRSGATERAYRDVLATFRAVLQAANLDLDSDPVLIATIAQGWADYRERGNGPVANTTHNQRLAILSSFYQTSIKKGFLTANPITRAERRPVDDYAEAKALEAGELRRRLAAIDRSALAGLRDYALLGVLVNTGRWRAEVNAMRWSSLHIANQEVTVSFPRTKGGKSMRDTLPSAVGKALLEWLRAFYGAELGSLPLKHRSGFPSPPTATVGRSASRRSARSAPRGSGNRKFIRYATPFGGSPSLHDLLIRLTSASAAELSRLRVESFGFKWTVEEQCEVLQMTRREISPRLKAIPASVSGLLRPLYVPILRWTGPAAVWESCS